MVSVRPKGDKIGMWLGDSSASASIINIGKKVKERLNIDAEVSIPVFLTPTAFREKAAADPFCLHDLIE